MSESKNTPGPWTVKSTDTTYAVESPDGIRVVSTSWHQCLRKPYPLKAEAFANARLIAAAPDLLEALAECEDYLDNRADADCDQDGFVPNKEMRLLSVVREALAKAEGRS